MDRHFVTAILFRERVIYMLKKTLILICAIFLMTMASGCKNKAEETSAEKSGVREITVSCAGDCTLGTDSAFGGITFPVEVSNHGGDYGFFMRNVKPYFESDDLTIVNFEGTLTERGTRQDKTFAFRGSPEYTKVLTEGSIEAVTLANNHSKDYGDVSREDTIKYLEEAGIIWFEKLNTRVIDVKGVKVGLIGLYSLDGSSEGNLTPAIEKVKSDGAEIIIVQVHWGIEGNNYPDESQVNLAHRAIDEGADLVIGHHPHVLQGVECYKGKMIAYSLGNFCFGGNQNPRDKDSMIFRQTFRISKNSEKDCKDYVVIPCSISSVQGRNNYQPTPLKDSEKKRVENKIQTFSNELSDIKVKFEGYDTADTYEENPINENRSMIL